jgi:excisionase family DNA binding protein
MSKTSALCGVPLDDAVREIVRRLFQEELAPLIRSEMTQALFQQLEHWKEHRQEDAPGLPALLTVEEVAAHCDVTKPTVRKWIRSGGLPACQPGGSRVYRIRREDLDNFLARRSRTRANDTPNVEEQVARILDRVRTKAMNTSG